MADSDVVLTQGEVLALIRRTTDPDWLNGMLGQPDGHAIINAMTAIAAAASETVDQQVAACKISEAPTGAQARCELTLTRSTTATSATIPKEFKFVTSVGVQLCLSTPVEVAIGQATIVLPLQTQRQLDLVETTGPAFDDVLEPGDFLDDIISRDSVTVRDSDGDPLLGIGVEICSYVSSTAISGASMDWLSEHGKERACLRQPGEDGEAYRDRVRQLPDAVTPTAIQEAARGAQSQADLPDIFMVEPFLDQASDAAREALGLVFQDGYFAGDRPEDVGPDEVGDFCDDPFGVSLAAKLPFRTIECSGIRETRAYFRLAIDGQLRERNGATMYADDAYCDDQSWGYPDAGVDPQLKAAARAVVEEARNKKAAGVQFDLAIENGTVLNDTSVTAADPTGVTAWSLDADSGHAWMIRHGLMVALGQDGDGDSQPFDPSDAAYSLTFTLAGGATVTTGWLGATDSTPLSAARMAELMRYFHEPVTSIEAKVKSATSATIRLTVTLWTTAMVV